jgi:hypothetical protein
MRGLLSRHVLLLIATEIIRIVGGDKSESDDSAFVDHVGTKMLPMMMLRKMCLLHELTDLLSKLRGGLAWLFPFRKERARAITTTLANSSAATYIALEPLHCRVPVTTFIWQKDDFYQD